MAPVTSPVTAAAPDGGPDDRRCAVLSLAADEELAGSAPLDTAWLLVEHAGPWGRQALAEARLPEEVRAFLTGLPGVRVQLIRRPGGVSGPGVRVFAAQLTPDGARVRTALLDDQTDLLRLDVAALADDGGIGLDGVRRPALAGLHQRPPRPVLHRGRPSGRGHPRRPLARGHLGDDPPRRAPVRRAPCSRCPPAWCSGGSTWRPP